MQLFCLKFERQSADIPNYHDKQNLQHVGTSQKLVALQNCHSQESTVLGSFKSDFKSDWFGSNVSN